MAAGAVAKSNITEILLKTFPGAFISGKELRIPVSEDGQERQIKVALTCAKDNVPHDGDISFTAGAGGATEYKEPTDEEREKVVQLLVEMGLFINEPEE